MTRHLEVFTNPSVWQEIPYLDPERPVVSVVEPSRRGDGAGWTPMKLRAVSRQNTPKPNPPLLRLRRVLLAFIPLASHGVFGEGE